MINTETLRVKPITYKLDFDDEAMKKLRPFFKLESGSYSKITKTIEKPAGGSPKGNDTVKLQRKEAGKVHVELWNRNSSTPENLIGRGELNYDSLSSKEGEYEEWIPLYDRNGKQVGKALVEVHITPVKKNLSIDDIFERSIEDFNHSFKRAIEDMDRTFHHFDRFGLPGFTFPSLLASPRHEAIEEESQSESKKTSQKKSIESKKEQHQVAKRNEEKNQVMTHRRSLFDTTFEEMNRMFDRTLEDMHNRFEEMTKDMFTGFGSWIEDEDEKQQMDIEDEKSKNSGKLEQGHSDSKQEPRNQTNQGKAPEVEIKDEPLKHGSA